MVSIIPGEVDPLDGCSPSWCRISARALDAATQIVMGEAFVDADGTYDLTLPYGTYDLEIVDAWGEYFFSPSGISGLLVDAPDPITGQDFVGERAYIAGTVTIDPAEPDPLAGCSPTWCRLSIQVYDAATQSLMGEYYVDAGGSYRIPAWYGTWDIVPVDAWGELVFSPSRIDGIVVDADNGAVTGQDFYGERAHIAGTVTFDPAEPDPLAGCSPTWCRLSIQLYDAATQSLVGEYYVDADGSYRIPAWYGTWDIVPVDAWGELVFSPSRIDGIVVDADNGVVIGQDFYGERQCFDFDNDGFAFCDATCVPLGLPCGDCNDGDPLVNPGESELCDGLDNDCDVATPDGIGEPSYDEVCDGADADLCDEGRYYCDGISLRCSDTTSDDLDVCDGVDNDCDPASADGEEDPNVGVLCDGPDTDLCVDDAMVCVGGALGCSTGVDDVEGPGGTAVCEDSIDNDCDGAIDSDDTDCAVCGDSVCNVGEDCDTCPDDCVASVSECGDGICDPSRGEDCVSCDVDCRGRQSGKASNRFCCGDGDGDTPVGCEDPRCVQDAWECQDPVAVYCCGDGACEGDEDGAICEVDCGPPLCGDGTCDPAAGEDACTCEADCGAPPAAETICDDGGDDDCDSAVDCFDPDCTGDPACAAWCGDGICAAAAAEDCASCPADCPGVSGGKPANRHCCGNGVVEGPETPALCNGDI